MNHQQINKHHKSSQLFAQQPKNTQTQLPWYCYFCSTPDQEQNIIEVIQIQNHRTLQNQQKNKLRHSLKRSINASQQIGQKQKKQPKDQIKNQQKKLTQSLEFNLSSTCHNFQARPKQSYVHNQVQFKKTSANKNMNSGQFQRTSLYLSRPPNLRYTTTVRMNPQSNITGGIWKNDQTGRELISTTKSIKFTATSKSTLQESEKLLNQNKNCKVQRKDDNNNISSKNMSNFSSTSLPALQKNINIQSQIQLTENELQQRNYKNVSKLRYFKSDISTREEEDFSAPSSLKNLDQIQLASSTQSFVEYNILPPKKKISKKSSESLNSSGDIKSSFSQIGINRKIGIRKVQSIVSNQDQDEFSEVVYGQRSFLMPQIHEVQQLSRVSSRQSLENRQNQI